MPDRSTSDFDPTGWPVATCSSTTRRRISRLREESCSIHESYPGAAARGTPAAGTCMRPEQGRPSRPPGSERSGEQLGRHSSAEEPAARRERERLPPPGAARRRRRARLGPSARSRGGRERARDRRAARGRRAAGRASRVPELSSQRRVARARATAPHRHRARRRSARSTPRCGDAGRPGSTRPRSRRRGSRARASSRGCGARGDPGPPAGEPVEAEVRRLVPAVAGRGQRRRRHARSTPPSPPTGGQLAPKACVNRVPGFASSSYSDRCSGASANASARSWSRSEGSWPGIP